MAEKLLYHAIITPLTDEDGGGYAAFAPDLKGCIGDGETPEAALADLQLAVVAWTEAQGERGRPMPQPGSSMAEQDAEQSELIELLKKQSELIREQSAKIVAMSEEIEKLKRRGIAVTSIGQIHSMVVTAGGLDMDWVTTGPRCTAVVEVLNTPPKTRLAASTHTKS